ncbi:MAG: ATPase [Sulfobacillus acidophilus]|uniref:ATPase n=1 Tax=Sulfobacillus acidophilus TaxID=53633 RepID=A0A2T2WPM1_9FIRM|nr:MAG: ATPase [Sulfobacillus acidophilus]
MSHQRAWSAILENGRYLADDNTILMLSLAVEMGRPLLLEGPSGSGKTALAEALARGLVQPLVRLSCYEGLGASEALYDWNYHAQWASLTQNGSSNPFADEFLLPRPLLQAVQEPRSILLIDEVDRADEAFEALLLEYLSEFQISIPERGTVKAEHPPITLLTSNRQRALSDALRRRCLYLFVDWPNHQREETIVEFHVPDINTQVRRALVQTVHILRSWGLLKPPGLSETIDWARATALRGVTDWERSWVEKTLGLVIKDALDLERVQERIDELVVDPNT